MLRFMEYDVFPQLSISVFGDVDGIWVSSKVEPPQWSRALIDVDPNSLLNFDSQLGQNQINESTSFGVMN